MQIYSKNNKNCFFSLISWSIFILFVLSDRARWGLQNLYTEFQNSLIMQIYANLFKITKNASSFVNWFLSRLRSKCETIGITISGGGGGVNISG